MRFIFIYTDARSPTTVLVTDVTTITFTTVSERDAIQVNGKQNGLVGTYIFYRDSGQPAIMWE